MKKLWMIGWRLVFYGSLLAAGRVINDDRFLEALVSGMPEPTHFSRPPEVYNWRTFGAPLEAGFAKRDITPRDYLICLAGYTPFHPALVIHDHLWVKSLALRDADGRVAVFVSCDLIGLLPDEIKKIKAMVVNVDSSHVFIGCTHTHSGPDTIGLWGPLIFTGKRLGYQRLMRAQVAAAIDQSVADLKPAKIRFGKAALAAEFVHGRFENPNDLSISVLQVLFRTGRPVTLVNFACHADVEMNFNLTADFPYYLYERLGRFTGGEVMYLQAAIGGVQPDKGDIDEWPSFARTIGENLADAVQFRALRQPVVPMQAKISFRQLIVQAPLENRNFAYAAKMGVISDLRDSRGMIHAELNRIDIGPAEILTVCGELFPKIWWRVKPLMSGNPNFIFGLTNGEYGYILLPEDWKSGRHKYHCAVSIGPQFGTAVAEGLKQLAAGH